MLYRMSILIIVSSLIGCPPVVASQFDSNIQFLAQELTKELELSQKRVLAVANFIDLQGNETELGKYLAEEFSFAMREANPKLSIIDRSRINFLLKEQGLTTSGLVDPKATAKLGKLAGIEALLTGIITPRGDSIRLTVKALDLETAITLADARGEIPRTQSLSALFDSFIQREEKNNVSQSSRSNRKNGSRNKLSISQTVTMDEYKADLTQCALDNKLITCNILFTRTGKGDVQAYFYRNNADGQRTRIFDSNGSETWATILSVGQKLCDKCGSIYTMVPQGVPIRITASFKVASNDTDFLTLLEIVFRPESSRNNYRLKFRDVPIVKK